MKDKQNGFLRNRCVLSAYGWDWTKNKKEPQVNSPHFLNFFSLKYTSHFFYWPNLPNVGYKGENACELSRNPCRVWSDLTNWEIRWCWAKHILIRYCGTGSHSLCFCLFPPLVLKPYHFNPNKNFVQPKHYRCRKVWTYGSFFMCVYLLFYQSSI